MKTGVAGAKTTLAKRARRATLLAGLALLAVPALSLAHPERPSYWPDPRPDTAVSPPAGGKVPQARSLASAVTGAGPGNVRVVCKGTGGSVSLALLEDSLEVARTQGFRLRPSQPKIVYTAERAAELRGINQALAERCQYHSVQPAVNASRQQRSGRDPARPLHGAGVPGSANRRSALRAQPVPRPGQWRLRHRASSIRRPVPTTRT